MASKYNISKIVSSIISNKKEEDEDKTNSEQTSTSQSEQTTTPKKQDNSSTTTKSTSQPVTMDKTTEDINPTTSKEKDESNKTEVLNTPKTISSSTTENKSEDETTSQNSNSATTKSKSASDIISDLRDIERNYNQNDYVDAPESLGLQTVDVPEKTEDELISLAKSSLQSKYNQKAETTNNNFAKQIESILASKENAQKSANQKSEQITSAYDTSIKETEAQALKRGLARSSIIISQIAGLEGGKASELSNVLSDLQDNLLEAENKIAQLESEQQTALNNLDLEYAEELDGEIESTRTAYEKARQQAIEFNNSVAKLEAEYKLKLDQQKLDKQSELTQLESKYGTSYTRNLIANEQYNYLKNYLDTLDKDYAISLLLTNKEFQSILGSRYSELYQYLRSK